MYSDRDDRKLRPRTAIPPHLAYERDDRIATGVPSAAHHRVCALGCGGGTARLAASGE